MEVGRYVGDAAPNGKLFWRLTPAFGPKTLIELAPLSVRWTVRRNLRSTIPRQKGVGWGIAGKPRFLQRKIGSTALLNSFLFLAEAVLYFGVMVSVACVLTFDQTGFFTALHFVTGAPIAVFFGGWFAKMGAALVYSVMLVAHIRWFEARQIPAPRGLSDIFDTLTYRERYEALVEHVGRDGLTGLLHRGRFDSDGGAAVAASLRTAKPLSLLVIDVDHFKSINDRFGHAEGDKVLKSVAALLGEIVGPEDQVFRIGGEEFAIL